MNSFRTTIYKQHSPSHLLNLFAGTEANVLWPTIQSRPAGCVVHYCFACVAIVCHERCTWCTSRPTKLNKRCMLCVFSYFPFWFICYKMFKSLNWLSLMQRLKWRMLDLIQLQFKTPFQCLYIVQHIVSWVGTQLHYKGTCRLSRRMCNNKYIIHTNFTLRGNLLYVST